MARQVYVLGLLMSCAGLSFAQTTIINTGSTNVPGMNVKLEKTGPRAMIEQRDGSQQKITLEKEVLNKLAEDLKAAGPLNQLPIPHCMKSVSFGSSLFIEHNGIRSPDLNCPQADPRSAALKKDAMDIMAAAKTQAPVAKRLRPMMQ